MSDWEDDSDDAKAPAPVKAAPIKPVGKSKWEGEDEDEDKGNVSWDASSDDDDSKPARPIGSASSSAPKKKGTLKQKLAQKEAERAAREAAGETTSLAEDFIEDPAVLKARLRAAEIEADLTNAAALFGSSDDGAADGSQAQQLAHLLTFSPKSKEDFVKLSDQLMNLVISQHANKPLYATFVELFARELAGPLRDVETRKVASTLTALANEKQKEQRDKTTGKAKKKVAGKPALGLGKTGTRADTSTYDEVLDDFGKNDDDFM